MYDWVASGSIWYRHFLSFIGVPPESLEWWIGDIDAPRATTHLYTLPAGVHQPPEGRCLSEMLIAGELDAIYSPRGRSSTTRSTARSSGSFPTSARSSAPISGGPAASRRSTS